MPIRGYGVMLLAGIVAGVTMAVYRARQVGVDQEVILSHTIWLVISGVIGARVFYVVEYWERFAGQSLNRMLADVVNIPEGGLVIYGGFIGAAIGFLAFTAKEKLPVLATADLIAPSLMIGLALGRIGCLLNGCCYGGTTDRPWAVTFPKYSSRFEADAPNAAVRYSPPYGDQASRGEMHGFRIDSLGNQPAVVTRVDADSPAAAAGLKAGSVIDSINGDRIKSLEQAKGLIVDAFNAQKELRLTLVSGQSLKIAPVPPPPRSRPVHPTQLYSAIDAALLGWLLWAWYPFRRRDGEVIALMLTIHPITRFLLEVIRTDEPAVFGTGMSISQNISLVLLVFAAGLWWYIERQPRGLVWTLRP
jgi:phosphatidylglycerol:prolipoprotein diacylglycerol transferase